MRRASLLILAAIIAVTCGLQARGATLQLAGHEVRAERLLVRLKPGADAQQQAANVLQAVGMTVRREFKSVPGLAVLELKDPAATALLPKEQQARLLAARIQTLRDSGRFLYVEPDYVVHAAATPTDSAFTNGTLWGLRNTGQFGGRPGADIGVTNAWNVTVGNTNVIVAVIDSGVRYTHRDLAAQMWRNPGEIPGNGVDDDNDGYVDNVFGINAINNSGDPFDDNDHGTHCAGTIGAAANDINPHVGVAWSVQIMACKFLDASGSGFGSDAIQCIDFTTQKRVRISNNSWGGGPFSQALFDAILAARNAGCLFLAAAGNGGTDGVGDDNDSTPFYPSSYDIDNIVSVAALDRSDNLGVFSNFGRTSVDIGAPGVEIFSTTAQSDTDYQTFQGTSMATPHVSGVAALVLSTSTGMSLTELRNRILNSAVPVAALQGRSVTGGRVNAANAIGFGTVTLSATNSAVGEGDFGNTSVVFKVTLSLPPTNTVQVSYATTNGTALANSDYLPASGVLTFPPGVTSQNISVPVFGDTAIEQNETFFLSFSSTNVFLNAPQVVGTILNDDGPVLRVNDVTIEEGDVGTNALFTVTLSQPVASPVFVNFSTLDGSAAAGLDYVATNGLLFFPSGVVTQTVSVVVISDLAFEPVESFYFALSNSSVATIFRDLGVGTIIDDDAQLMIDDTGVIEGDSGTANAVFAVRLSKPSTNIVSVAFRTGSFSASGGADFLSTNGLVTFAAGVTNTTLMVPIFGETLNESNEIFTVTIFNPTNATVTRASAVCIITNDDPLPGVSIVSAVSVTEGSTGNSSALVALSLTAASGQIIQVAYATAVGTASPGSDYVASSGVLVFPTNTTSRVISIPILGDSNYEGNETFTVRISSPNNATNVVGQDVSTVTIVDDDPVPLIGVSDVSLFEGNSGTTTAVFSVTLSVSSGLPVTVNYATSDLSPATGAAVSGTDYVSAGGTVTFPPGSTSQTVSITVNSDVLEEPNEAFFLDLSAASNAIIARNRGFGTILNDDGPILQISDVTLVEGNSGTTNAVFTVTLLPADEGTVTVLYATSNMTATAGLDYVATNGSLSFVPGQTSTNITVVVNGEAFLESDEAFAVVLSSATNATIGRAVGTATIKDDDTLADLELAVARSSFVGSGLTNFVGHHITYLITVTNRGPLPSTNVVVTNLLPTSFTVVSWTNSQGTFSSSSGLAVFNAGTLASNAGFTASLVVAPTAVGSFTNSVSVLGQQPDTNLLNNATNLLSAIMTPQVALTGGAVLSLVAEGVQPPNGSFDAAEFVTVALTLQNLGNVAATNVSVSLLSGTGVHAPSGAQSYGALATNLPTSRQFNFTANTAGGDVITTFVITDGTNSMGTVSFTNRTGSSSASANTASVSIPAFGAAATYPSVINVSGVAGVVNKVSITLSNLSHSWPADLDVLLVGPSGQSVLVLSDAAGGNNPVSGVTLKFDDAAASPLVEFGPVASGIYKPSNYDASDSFPAPAPSAPYGSQMSVFNGTDPNGAWSLFIVDDANGDLGALSGGWRLEIETAAPVNTTAALAVSLTATPDPVRVGSNLVYTITVTNRGPSAATSVVLSNILPFQAVLVATPAFTQGTVVTNSEGILVASLGKILSGASVDGVITVINQAAGTATNIVTVAGNETDANLADNVAVNVTRINRVVALASQSTSTLTNGQFGLTLNGSAGLTYVIEVSTNLVHWTPIFTNPPGGGTANFVDTNAATGLRFYRAVER